MHQEHKELLQELYETYQRALRLTALGMKVPECEVDDIIQDTFVAFMVKYEDRFPDWNMAQRKGMLMRILKNRCNDYFRSLKRHGEISIDANDSVIEAEILRNRVEEDASKGLIEDEELKRIHEEILSMPQALREVAILYMVEGRPREQVCQILDIKDSTCRMRISRIRERITKLLKKRNQLS